MKRPPVVIVGAGRLGCGLARALLRSGWPLRVLPQSPQGRARCRQHRLPIATGADLIAAKVVFLTVTDPAICTVANDLHPQLSKGCALVHCSGALPVTALAGHHRTVGSFHPLCAVSFRRAEFAGCSAAIKTTSAALRKVLLGMARDLRLIPMSVPERSRVAYHAAAVLAAGSTVSLLAAAARTLTAAGVPKVKAARAVAALAQSAISGVANGNFAAAMTGPVARADWQTIERHVAALPSAVRPIYRALSDYGATHVLNQPLPHRSGSRHQKQRST